jgi:hypothetical protein
MRKIWAATREESRAVFSKKLKQTITHSLPLVFFCVAPLLLRLLLRLQEHL